MLYTDRFQSMHEDRSLLEAGDRLPRCPSGSSSKSLLVVVVVVVNLYLSTVQNSSALKIPNTNIIKIFKYNKNI